MLAEPTNGGAELSNEAGSAPEPRTSEAGEAETHNSLKDLEVNLNELRILEDDLKAALSQYRNYNYAQAFELFLRVLEDAARIGEADTEREALRYLAKISILRGDSEGGLKHLAKLEITPKTLSLLARCLLLSHEQRGEAETLRVSKELLYLALSSCCEEELNDASQRPEPSTLNFYLKNNLLMLHVHKQLGEYVQYYNLLENASLFLQKYSKSVKSKHVAHFGRIAGEPRGWKRPLDEGSARPVFAELEEREREELSQELVELVGEVCRGCYEECLELRIEGSVGDILAYLLEFYDRLERMEIAPFREAVTVLDANDLSTCLPDGPPEAAACAERQQHTRQGQREVKRRIIGMEGDSTKSVYLKNYWTSICNFFYMADFNNSLSGSAGGARREEEEEEDVVDTIYPSDIGRYLKYSETYYSLRLVRSPGRRAGRRVSERTSLHRISGFARTLAGARHTPVSLSLKLLRFLLRNHRIGAGNANYQLLVAVAYLYVHEALLGQEVTCDGESRGVAASSLYSLNRLLARPGPHVEQFRLLNLSYGTRILSVLQRSRTGPGEAAGAEQGSRSPRNTPGVADKAYVVCLFYMYKLCPCDYLRRMHVLYFYAKRLGLDRLEAGDGIYQAMEQCKYVEQYGGARSRRGGRDGGARNTAAGRAARASRRRRLDRHAEALFNGLGNFVLSHGNLEAQLGRFAKRFLAVVAKYVDPATARQVYAATCGARTEDELADLAAHYGSYASKRLDGALYGELQQFLLEVTSFIAGQERCPSWADELLLLYGDILSVISFNLHRNISNIQLGGQFDFLFADSLGHQFLLTLCSTLLVLVNRLYHFKYECVLGGGAWEGGGRGEGGAYASCLKEVELLGGYSLVLRSSVSRIYTNVVFIVYYLIHCLTSDYNQPDAATIYYLYVAFSQVAVIILSALFNIGISAPASPAGALRLELPQLLAVTRDEPEGPLEQGGGSEREEFEDPGSLDKNVMECYYTYNNILDSVLQIDMLFREKGLSLDAQLVPARLASCIYARSDGLEFADSAASLNLSLSTLVFNRLTQLFNPGFGESLAADLELALGARSLVGAQYLPLLRELHLRLGRRSLGGGVGAEDGERGSGGPRRLRLDKDVGALINELAAKCISNAIGKEFSSPVLALVYVHFRRVENVDNQLYLFKELLDRMSMPHEGGVNFFARHPNPLITAGGKAGREGRGEWESGGLEGQGEGHKGRAPAPELPGSALDSNNRAAVPCHGPPVEQATKHVPPCAMDGSGPGSSLHTNAEASVQGAAVDCPGGPNTASDSNPCNADSGVEDSSGPGVNAGATEGKMEGAPNVSHAGGAVGAVGAVGAADLPGPSGAGSEAGSPLLAEHLRYVGALGELLEGEDMFSHGDLLSRYEAAPEYGFMQTHRAIYLRILSSYSAIDAIKTFDIESYSADYLLSQLEVINLASVVLRGSYDVLFLAVIKNFELLLSLLDVRQFSARCAFGGGARGAADGAEPLELIRRLMGLLHVAIHKYGQLVQDRAGPREGWQLFYGEFRDAAYRSEEAGEPGSFSHKLAKRLRLMHLVRIVLLVMVLRRGLLVPSTLLFSDYCLLAQYLAGPVPPPEPPRVPGTLEEFVLYSPPGPAELGHASYLYVLYLQTKIFDRVVKNVSLTPELWRTIYAKILVNYMRYLRTLVESKRLAGELGPTDSNGCDGTTDGCDGTVGGDGTTDGCDGTVGGDGTGDSTGDGTGNGGAGGGTGEGGEAPGAALTMSQLNRIFERNYGGANADVELTIVYYKLHCARLRLLYLFPRLYHLAAPFSFSEARNAHFWSPELERLLEREEYAQWSQLVERGASSAGIRRADVELDVLEFFNRIRASPDSDIGCMVCYKLACHSYKAGDVEGSVQHLERMGEKVVLHDDFIRFAVNFEITFLKSSRKVLTNTCRILMAVVCEAVHHSKLVQDRQVQAFRQSFYASAAAGQGCAGRPKGRPRPAKRAPGNWVFAGHERAQALDHVHRLVQLLLAVLQKLNRKFKELAELDRSSLLFSTLAHAQSLVLNALTYCFVLLVGACPHVLSLALMQQVLDAEDVRALVESQHVAPGRPGHPAAVAGTLHELITSRADEPDAYAFLERSGALVRGSVCSEYNALTATLDLRLLRQLHALWSLKLFLRPPEVAEKLAELFMDACNRLLYIVPADPALLGDAQHVELPSGQRVQISEEWALNQSITTIQRASAAFNEAVARQS